ncbi:MAG: type VI secretion system protein TssA [Candidatus Acidiferrales bacterium]|jgi:type VI secretion system protein ImpA
MALPENILNPIPGENPSGRNLRWEDVYEKVKEARREEEDLPSGDWSRAVKSADPAAVILLTTDALSTKTKDLQLAAWLTEALIRQDGIGGLREGLDLIRGLSENFWDTVYPEAEDGDIELRTAPLNWVGSYLSQQVRKTPLTRGRCDWFKYLESRAVGYEAACEGNDAKMARRRDAIAENKLTPEIFDKDMNSTTPEFYVKLVKNFDGALSSLQSLDDWCKEKLGRDSPNFGSLRTALDEVQSLAQSFLKTKQKPEEPKEKEEVPQEESEWSPPVAEEPAPSVRKRTVSEEPVDREDAIRRIVAGADFLRHAEPSNPASYLVLRGLRWGELLAKGSSGNMELEAPPSEIRQKLKRLALDGQWSDLLEACEGAMALACGMAWLDLQRYAVRACQETGGAHDAVGKAIRSVLQALLSQVPGLPQSSFIDDTPVANSDTIVWLQEVSNSSQQQSAENVSAPPSLDEAAASPTQEEAPDSRKLAMQAARSGRMQEAMEILTRDIAQERSGRARFGKKIQLASVCLDTGHESIAYPILKELAQEIERRKLEEWESPTSVANSLTLLFRCLNKMGGDAAEKQEIYQRICRLDPVQALDCMK